MRFISEYPENGLELAWTLWSTKLRNPKIYDTRKQNDQICNKIGCKIFFNKKNPSGSEKEEPVSDSVYTLTLQSVTLYLKEDRSFPKHVV